MAATSGPVVYEGWFNWQVPHGWDLENGEDGLISVHSEVGSFYISCFDRTSPTPPSVQEAEQMALRFAGEQGWRVKKGDVKSRLLLQTPVSEFEHDDGERPASHWHVWHMVGTQRAVLVTYVCPHAKAEAERGVRTRMVDSFEWEPLE
jgi:hypothetical protein